MATKTPDEANGGGYGQSPEIAALTERMIKLDAMIVTEMARRDAALQEQVGQLREVVAQLAGASALECILQNGLGEIVDGLAPLRQLVASRTRLPEKGLADLQEVRGALARPDFSRIDAPLSVDAAPKSQRTAS